MYNYTAVTPEAALTLFVLQLLVISGTALDESRVTTDCLVTLYVKRSTYDFIRAHVRVVHRSEYISLG